MRGQRGTLPVHVLRYVIVTKVIYRLAHKQKSVFRDVRIKTNLILIWNQCVNGGERWDIGKFCRWRDFQKEGKWYILSKNSQFEVCSTVPLDINGSLAGISDFGEYIVSEAGSDSGGVLRTMVAKTTRTVIIIRNPRPYQQFLHPSTEKSCSYTLFKR